MLRSHGLNPDFFTESLCCPAETPTVDGVLPTKLPSTSMSAPFGVDDTWTRACSDVEMRVLTDEFPAAWAEPCCAPGIWRGQASCHFSRVLGDCGARSLGESGRYRDRGWPSSSTLLSSPVLFASSRQCASWWRMGTQGPSASLGMTVWDGMTVGGRDDCVGSDLWCACSCLALPGWADEASASTRVVVNGWPIQAFLWLEWGCSFVTGLGPTNKLDSFHAWQTGALGRVVSPLRKMGYWSGWRIESAMDDAKTRDEWQEKFVAVVELPHSSQRRA